MRIIGLTGNIAAGKSTVSEELARLGAEVIDADGLAREALAEKSAGESEVKRVFGTDYFENGRLNRRKLGALVFENPAEREKLNAIVHPIIHRLLLERLDGLKTKKPGCTAVVDAALLFENGLEKLCTEVWLVTAPDSVREARIMKRDRLTQKEARDRVASQIPQEKKLALADRVLVNDTNREELLKKAGEFYLSPLERNNRNV